MEDDLNSAPTLGGQPATPQRQAHGQPQPPQPGPAPAPQAPQPWARGQTVPYNGPIDTEPPTVAMPPTAAMPPAVYQPQPSGPPVYVPPGFVPPTHTRQPQPSGRPPAQPAPRQLPALRQPQPSGRPGGQGGQRQPPQPRRPASWIPLPHTLLIVGVALLWVATLLPWAITSSGALIMLQTASIPALSAQSGGSALQIADELVGAVGTLSAGLLFFNLIVSGAVRLLGGGCLAGCLLAPFYPILMALGALLALVIVLAAGFGGFGALGQIPVVQSYGLGGLGAAHYEPGYYIWYTGLMLTAAGMLGELVVWRR